MKCPACEGGGHFVLSTRNHPQEVRRTRECGACGHRWTTVEMLADSAEMMTKAREFVRNMAALAKEIDHG